MAKRITFRVSEDRYTKYKEIGFEKIDHFLNNLIDEYEERQERGAKNNVKRTN